MNRMMSTRHRATVCRVERSERHRDQIAAFAVRQVAMREMHQASRNAAATLPTPESTDDAFCEVTEELTALRDLYEEAPIAYVIEDLESRFISANRAAQRILGIKPEEVVGTVGLSLVPDRPDAQRVAKEQFAIQIRGEETKGIVVELRRKNDGQPVWIEIWAKPKPGGKYRRTMFLDVTDAVPLERE